MKRKSILIILVISMLFTLILPACSSSEQEASAASTSTVSDKEVAEVEIKDEKTTAPEETTLPQETEPEVADSALPKTEYPLSAEKQTLSYWTLFNCPRTVTMESSSGIKGFQLAEEITNIQIEFIETSMEAELEKFNLMLVSGSFPDIISGFGSTYTGTLDDAIDNEIIIDISDMLNQYAPYYQELRSEDDQTFRDTMTDLGAIAGFCPISSEDAMPDGGLAVRQDWLDKLGMESPVTYDEYYAVLMAFKTEMGATMPLYLENSGVPSSNFLVDGYGVAGRISTAGPGTAPFYVVDGEVHFGPAEEGFREYLTMLSEWYSEGLISTDFITAGGTGHDNAFTSAVTEGKTGIFDGVSGYLTMIKTQALDPDFELSALHDAVKVKGDQTHLAPASSKVAAVSMAISTKCANPELAVQWCDFWYSQQGILLTNYGIENESYTLENGEPVFTDIILANPDGLDFSDIKFMYTPNVATYQDPNIKIKNSSAETQSVITTWMTDRDSLYSYPNLATMTAIESEMYTVGYADISTLCTEMIAKFITGQEPLSGFDNYVSMLYELGLSDCLSSKQSAYDRYASSAG